MKMTATTMKVMIPTPPTTPPTTAPILLVLGDVGATGAIVAPGPLFEFPVVVLDCSVFDVGASGAVVAPESLFEPPVGVLD